MLNTITMLSYFNITQGAVTLMFNKDISLFRNIQGRLGIIMYSGSGVTLSILLLSFSICRFVDFVGFFVWF